MFNEDDFIIDSDDTLIEELEDDFEFISDVEDVELVSISETDLPENRIELLGVNSQEEAEFLGELFSAESESSLPVYLMYNDTPLLMGYTELTSNIFITIRNVSDKYEVTLISGTNSKLILGPSVSDEDLIENIMLFIRAR